MAPIDQRRAPLKLNIPPSVPYYLFDKKKMVEKNEDLDNDDSDDNLNDDLDDDLNEEEIASLRKKYEYLPPSPSPSDDEDDDSTTTTSYPNEKRLDETNMRHKSYMTKDDMKDILKKEKIPFKSSDHRHV
jgi:hypothetical protein